MLAEVALVGGVLRFTAGAGEANDLAIEVASTLRGSDLLLTERGPGIALTISGSGLALDSPTRVRVNAARVTAIEIRTGDETDAVTIALASGLPETIHVDTGDAEGDRLTIIGTPGNDSIGLTRQRNSEGLKVVQLTHELTTVSLLGAESLTLDLSQDGDDAVTFDRFISGIERPLAIHLIAGGAGRDTMTIVAEGDVPQVVTIGDGVVQLADAAGGAELFLGRSDNIAIDQPRVAVEVIDERGGQPRSLGPQIFNTMLLDTGATGIVFTAAPTSELNQHGYRTEGLYEEQGVAGTTLMDVSASYRFDFAGYSGQRNTLRDVRLLSSNSLHFSFFGPWGIVGMPAMVDRVTRIDMTGWSNLRDIFDLSIKTEFFSEPPEDSGHFRRVPLELVDFPANGQVGNDPIPTFAPLPLVPVEARDNGNVFRGKFLLDTGAQLSLITTEAAIALGLDKNNNGTLEDEALDHIAVGGIGGTVVIPLVAFDRLAVPTLEGQDVVFTELLVGVLDIEVEDGPKFDGVFGMDFLTSGWANKVLPSLLGLPGSELDGYFQHVYFDFRDADQRTGTMILDVTPERDVVRPTASYPLTITHSGLDALSVTTGDGDDRFLVAPSRTIDITVDGGPHVLGDSLSLVPPDLSAEIESATILVSGYRPITFANIEHIQDHQGPTANIIDVEPNPRTTSVEAIDLVFDEPVRGVTLDDLRLTRSGVEVPLDGATLTTSDWVTWTLGGLSDLTADVGTYVLTLTAEGSGIEDAAGNALVADATEEWVVIAQGGPFLSSGVVVVSSDRWTTVRLDRRYDSMVVVATPAYGPGSPPLITRVRAASGDRFELTVARADNSAEPFGPVTVHYLVAEEGVYTVAEHGITMEAVRFTSTVTDVGSNSTAASSWVGQARSYGQGYTKPVVVGQVMTADDPRPSVFWARGARRDQPPSSSALYVGKHVGEDPQRSRADEQIGYFVFEAGSYTVDGSVVVARLGPNTVQGVGNAPPYSYSLTGLETATATAAVASPAGIRGVNGGWPVLWGAEPVTATRLDLAFEEDTWYDAERQHITERVAYVVVGSAQLAGSEGGGSAMGGDSRVPIPRGSGLGESNPSRPASAPLSIRWSQLVEAYRGPVADRVNGSGGSRLNPQEAVGSHPLALGGLPAALAPPPGPSAPLVDALFSHEPSDGELLRLAPHRETPTIGPAMRAGLPLGVDRLPRPMVPFWFLLAEEWGPSGLDPLRDLWDEADEERGHSRPPSRLRPIE